jgi:hypothetical protein
VDLLQQGLFDTTAKMAVRAQFENSNEYVPHHDGFLLHFAQMRKQFV